jgi:hypothetical protein
LRRDSRWVNITNHINRWEKEKNEERERERRYGERKMETSTLRVDVRKEINEILYI